MWWYYFRFFFTKDSFLNINRKQRRYATRILSISVDDMYNQTHTGRSAQRKTNNHDHHVIINIISSINIFIIILWPSIARRYKTLWNTILCFSAHNAADQMFTQTMTPILGQEMRLSHSPSRTEAEFQPCREYALRICLTHVLCVCVSEGDLLNMNYCGQQQLDNSQPDKLLSCRDSVSTAPSRLYILIDIYYYSY